jgi:hypothetical protein
MREIGLVEAIDAVRREIAEAARGVDAHELQFPVGGVQLTFQLGVTRDEQDSAKVKLWVLEVGGEASVEHQLVHSVTVNLDPPLLPSGHSIKVTNDTIAKP